MGVEVQAGVKAVYLKAEPIKTVRSKSVWEGWYGLTDVKSILWSVL